MARKSRKFWHRYPLSRWGVTMVIYRNIVKSFLRLEIKSLETSWWLIERQEPVPAVPVGTDAHGIIYHLCSRWKISATPLAAYPRSGQHSISGTGSDRLFHPVRPFQPWLFQQTAFNRTVHIPRLSFRLFVLRDSGHLRQKRALSRSSFH